MGALDIRGLVAGGLRALAAPLLGLQRVDRVMYMAPTRLVIPA